MLVFGFLLWFFFHKRGKSNAWKLTVFSFMMYDRNLKQTVRSTVISRAAVHLWVFHTLPQGIITKSQYQHVTIWSDPIETCDYSLDTICRNLLKRAYVWISSEHAAFKNQKNVCICVFPGHACFFGVFFWHKWNGLSLQRRKGTSQPASHNGHACFKKNRNKNVRIRFRCSEMLVTWCT
jgi:hypothetical protein